MSNQEPTAPYVYQPYAAGENFGRLWGVGGPDLFGATIKGLTREQAEAIRAALTPASPSSSPPTASEPLRAWKQKWYPLIAGRVIALANAGETKAHEVWAECAKELAVEESMTAVFDGYCGGEIAIKGTDLPRWGCGKPVSLSDGGAHEIGYRCTGCSNVFHLACALEHFGGAALSSSGGVR